MTNIFEIQGSKIEGWKKKNLMSISQILNRIDENIDEYQSIITSEEKGYLSDKFNTAFNDIQRSAPSSVFKFLRLPAELRNLIYTFCDANNLWNLQQVCTTLRKEVSPIYICLGDVRYKLGKRLDRAGVKLLLKHCLDLPKYLDDALEDFISLLAGSLVYLSCYPLDNHVSDLNFRGLLRSIVLLLPARADVLLSASGPLGMERERSQADHTRLLFQSMAEFNASSDAAHDEEKWQRHSRDMIFQNQSSQHPQHPIVDNRNQDGDEVYHDIIDVLDGTQPEQRLGHATIPRDSFRDLAGQLHSYPPLHQLSMPMNILELFIKTLLGLQIHSSGIKPSMQGLTIAARNITKSFLQNQDKVDWIAFSSSIHYTFPLFCSPFYTLLSRLLGQNEVFKVPSPPKLGKVLDIVRMTQLNTFLYDSVAFDDMHLAYNTETRTASLLELMKVLESRTQETILLVSGKPARPVHGQSMEPYIFGFFSPFPEVDKNTITSTGQAAWRGCLMFQLSPVQNVYEGKIGSQPWTKEQQGIVFGDRHAGFSTYLDNTMDHAQVTSSGGNSSNANGFWSKHCQNVSSMDIIVQNVELWVAEY